MNPTIDTPFYVIRRKATGYLGKQDTFMSLRGGWTTKPVFALTFRTEAAARAWLGNRRGEIVTADSIGLEIKP